MYQEKAQFKLPKYFSNLWTDQVSICKFIDSQKTVVKFNLKLWWKKICIPTTVSIEIVPRSRPTSQKRSQPLELIKKIVKAFDVGLHS